MSQDQCVFGSWFEGQHFGPRNGLEERDWQIAAHRKFVVKVNAWASRAADEQGQLSFCIFAGTGSGKTKAAGLDAAFLLNGKLVDQVVYVCPNDVIREQAKEDFYRYFGIELVSFSSKHHKRGVPRSTQGYALTYSLLMQNPELHQKLCRDTRTLVIFDEVHHLADHSHWGVSAREAFGAAAVVLSLSGTPFRTDKTPIPFVEYDEADANGLSRLKADHVYTLGKAVAEGICRKPVFFFADAIVRIRSKADGQVREVTFQDALEGPDISQRRRIAVRHGSVARKEMIAEALRVCRAERRNLIIFLGGDTEGDHTPTDDARKLLPMELAELGVRPEEVLVATGGDPEARRKLKDVAGVPPNWILAAINMLSEGADYPSFSAALFLTTITAKQTTIQRIGRILRLMGENDPHQTAYIWMFRDADYVDIHLEMEDQIKQEVDLLKVQKERETREGIGPRRREPDDGVVISGGEVVSIAAHGFEYPIQRIRDKQAELRRRGLPATVAMAIWSLILEEEDRDVA